MKVVQIILFVMMTISCSKSDEQVSNNTQEFTNKIADDRMTLVLSAPSVVDQYYSTNFNAIVDFQIRYANAIMGNDNVIIIVDSLTKQYYEGRVPKDVLIIAEVYDIWMRDFTTINPFSPVSFKYTSASMSTSESIAVQNSFRAFAQAIGIENTSTSLRLDGGNIVDNYDGKIITTTRFLEDNNLEMEEGKNMLKSLLSASEVAIIPYDDPVLAHADGMLMWLENNTLLIKDYSDDPEFKNSVIDELMASFSNINIIQVPVNFDDQSSNGIGSACGINLNATLTFHSVYVPVFDMSHDANALEIIQHNTNKKVIPVLAKEVCELGGSVRCLTWQTTGDNAEKLILAGRY